MSQKSPEEHDADAYYRGLPAHMPVNREVALKIVNAAIVDLQFLAAWLEQTDAPVLSKSTVATLATVHAVMGASESECRH